MAISYSYTKAVNSDRLTIEINTYFSGLINIETSPSSNSVTIWFENAINETTLAGIVENHINMPPDIPADVVVNTNPNAPVTVITAADGQAVAIQEWKSYSGDTLVSITPAGALLLAPTSGAPLVLAQSAHGLLIEGLNAETLAGKDPSWFESANVNIQQHISSNTNPHSTTAAQVSAIATTHPANSITGFGSSDPTMDGVASAGDATTIARSNHVHPSDTSRAAAGHDHNSTYAPIANGVTNGDLHNHIDGDGGQISHTSLSDIGTNSHGNIDSHIASTANPHSVTKSQVGLGNVTNDAQIPLTQKGAVSGVCPLNSSTKIDTAYMPESVLGQVEYKGAWAASTNTPTLPTTAVGNKGWYYVCSDSGNQFGIDFNTGDWVISNGTSWEKIDTTQAVQSVFNRTGAIVAANGDYTASQITNVAAGNIEATTVQGAINELDLEKAAASHTHAGTYEPVVTVLPVSKGGTGISSYTAGNFVSALDSSNLQQRTPVQVLSDIGAAATSHAHAQSQSHNSPDTDSSATALHHTLGTGQYQAASGTHAHTGVYESANSNIQNHISATSNPHSVTKTQVGLGNVTNDAQVPLTQKGAASGVCPLDANTKISTAYLPDSISGSMTYKGVWNASTNTPTIPTPSSGNLGWYYIVNVAGTYNYVEYFVGDWIISDGSSWNRIPNAAGVTSVFSRTGNVVSGNGDYTAGQITNVANGNISSVTVQAAINELDSEKQPLDATLTALAGLTTSANNILLCTGSDTFSVGQLSNAYVASDAAIVVSKLGQSGASTGQTVIWNGSAWAPTLITDANVASNAAIAISKLGTSGVTTDDIIAYNGSSWVSGKIANTNIATNADIAVSKLGASSASASDVLYFNGTNWAPAKIADANVAGNAAISVGKLGQSGATTSQILNWNGSAWAPTLLSNTNVSDAAGIVVSKLGASSAATDDVLAYSGTTWAPIKITASHVNASYKDGTAGTPSLRTLGTGASQAAAGNHNHSGVYEPVFAILAVGKGGTGVNTLSGLIKGNGTSAFSAAQAGTDYVSPTSTESLSNKTLTAPKILNTGYIADDNGNEQVQFSTTTSAINHIQIKNASTTNAPSIIAVGEDTDISLHLLGQGAGVVTTTTAAADTNTTQIATTAFVLGQASATNPLMDGSVSTGTSYKYARQDHVHPTDTSRQPLDGTLSALAGLTTSANNLILATGADTFSVGQLSDAYIASNAAIGITKLSVSGAATEDVIYYNGTNLAYGKAAIVPLEYNDIYTTLATTTLQTYQTYRSFGTTTLRAKTYKVSWSFRYHHSASKSAFSARIYLDGATSLWEMIVRVPSNVAALRYPASGCAFVTFATEATHTIALQFMSEASNATATIFDSVISIAEVRTA